MKPRQGTKKINKTTTLRDDQNTGDAPFGDDGAKGMCLAAVGMGSARWVHALAPEG
jgi:hypothetical protein